MHFALRGYLFIALTALLGVAGTWSDVPGFAGAWLLPAFLLLAGLTIEAWYLHGTQVTGLDFRANEGRTHARHSRQLGRGEWWTLLERQVAEPPFVCVRNLSLRHYTPIGTSARAGTIDIREPWMTSVIA